MKKYFSVQKIAVLGLLLALNVVLGKFATIHTDTVKIGFAFITLVAAGALFGPVEAGLVGALGDILGWVINPIGGYFPGFTITAFLTGMVYGLFLRKKINLVRICLSTAIVQFIIGLIINTFCLTLLYGSGFIALLPSRLVQSLILFVIQAVIIWIMGKLLIPRLKVTLAGAGELPEAK